MCQTIGQMQGNQQLQLTTGPSRQIVQHITPCEMVATYLPYRHENGVIVLIDLLARKWMSIFLKKSNFNRLHVTHGFASSGLLNLIKNVNDMADSTLNSNDNLYNVYDTNNITNKWIYYLKSTSWQVFV